MLVSEGSSEEGESVVIPRATQAARRPVYDPAVVYILEFCTILALKDSDTIELVGKSVVEALQIILRNSGRFHTVLVSRAVYYQLNVLKASYVSKP